MAGRRHDALRHETAELGATRAHVLHLGTRVVRTEERRLDDLAVRDRNAKAVAEVTQVGVVHLLLRMGDVLALTGLAKSVALDGAREDTVGPSVCDMAAR